MGLSRKGQYTNLAIAIRLLGSVYPFSWAEYENQSGFWTQASQTTSVNKRALIENLSQKFSGPNIGAAPIKQKIVVYVRKKLPVFENIVDPSHPEYKTRVTVEYNGKNYRLTSEQRIMESVYSYVGQLEDM